MFNAILAEQKAAKPKRFRFRKFVEVVMAGLVPATPIV
jgi:hypothetical protein